jgi:PAS domain S-box-containing protein
MQDRPQERILVIAPTGQDAQAIVRLLEEHGHHTEVCEGPNEACRLMVSGAALLLLAEEALELPQASELLEQLRNQPPWSELPLIVLTSSGKSRFAAMLERFAAAAGSVTLLERPIGTLTLLRSVDVALRARRRQYQVRDLLEDKARLAAIVESSNDAIISKDLSGVITTWNLAASKLFGYQASEVIGQPVIILNPEDRLDEEPEILNRIRRGESVEHFETVRRRKDGSLVDVSLTVSPIFGVRQEIIGASKIARDITTRKQIEKALEEAQEALRRHASSLEQIVADRTRDLRATNEQLEAFVYTIAHDLRAPLRSMIGYSQLLVDDYAAGLEPPARTLLKRIQGSSEFMDKLLLDLLAYGRAARAEIELVPVDVAKAWETAMFQCAAQIEQTQAQVEAMEPLPKVRAHEATLGQCLANLLSNALKFVSPGVQPRIRFWGEAAGPLVRLWVADNGIGIPAEQQERAFRVFERLNGARYSGTGVGLSIVRKGAERMGGRVGVESEPGSGSRFWIELHKAE